jgi:uncharacterized protein YfaS (alpha-2-macroglobulin family)
MSVFKKINLIPIFLLLGIIIFATNCQRKENRAAEMSPSVNAYVYGYTSGIISKATPVRIQFTNMMVDAETVGETAENGIVSFSPSVKGSFVWENEQTLRFDPDPTFESGTTYIAKVNLKKLIANVPAEANSFEFDFRTRDQFLNVSFKGFSTEDPNSLEKQKLAGEIKLADIADSENIESLLNANQKGKDLNITWNHNANQTISEFWIEGINRGNNPSEVEVKWNGKPLGIEMKSEKSFEVPSLDDFKVTDVSIINDAEKYILLNFSDPLKESQNLDGMINISDFSGSMRYLIEGNFVRVYPSGYLVGEHTINISTGIRNIQNKRMKNPGNWVFNFETAKPEVMLSGNGVILPNSDGLIFPFQAIGLNAVDVEVFKIFNNNILQFLQGNDIDRGRSNLYRVGRITMRKQVPLQNLNASASPDGWSTYALDLSKLVAQDAEAIYQIRIGFKPEYATYFCNTEEETSEDLTVVGASEEDLEKSIMDMWYGPNGWYRGYNWSDREDPCKPAYYNSDRFVSRNVFASNLGLIVKANEDKTYYTVVTDLRDAKPISGVTVEFFDFQQQVIGKGQTDAKGMATIQLEREPFVVLAKSGGDQGYLKLQDGHSLSLSRFDVSGARAQKGLKGFLYGERGVWRPGDSIYLNFILENETGYLPSNYPINMEVTDPRGQIIEKRNISEHTSGIYPLHFATSKDAPTGNWSVLVKAGGASFRKTIKVETVKPNRLKIDLDFGTETLKSANEPLMGNINARWLHGAPASNLKAKVEVQLRASNTKFDKYNNFEFDDPARKISAESRIIFDGQLDGSGKGSINTKILNNKLVPGKLTASFKSRVFEKGGDFSTDNFSLPYSPFDVYAGIAIPTNKYGSKRIDMNEEESLLFVALDENGKPLANRNLDIGLYRVQWRWWWDRGYDNVTRYNSGNHYDANETATIRTNNKGEANWDVKVTQWGRYLVRVCDPESGHCSGDFFYAGYPYNEGNNQGKEAAAMLNFSTDKQKYNIGEQVKLKIPMGKTGRALITIENGTKVLQSFWTESREGENEFTFETTEAMAPNVYAHVALLQEHAQVDNDLPIRLYGVIPVMVEDENTHLEPKLKIAEELRPEESFEVEVSESSGQAMAYTIAVVDEGLLGLTRYKTPDPWNTFYAKEALGVRTWDMYNFVLGAYGGKLEQILSIGGDGEVVNPDKEESANRFKPVVMHLGPFYLKKGKKAKHTLTMPNYVGEVRAMVVAANTDKAYGSVEKSIPVKKPLMVLATLPRVLSPGEEVLLPVNVFAMDKKVKSANITVEESSGLALIEGGNSQSVNFSKPGDKLVNFRVRMKEGVGVAKFKISASGGGEQTSQEIELQVRNPNPYTTEVFNQVVAAGDNWRVNYDPVGMAGTNEGVLEVSTIPPVNLGERLQYLLRYPYGCIEQTLSGGFPQLYVGKLLELDDDQKQNIPKNIRATIERLKLFQTSTGGIAYWPGGSTPNHWASSYAGHFMLEAKALGYSVPNNLLDNWAKFQKKVARMWQVDQNDYGFYNYRSNELSQAYRLYTLALYGEPELGAMNRLRESKDLGLQARWRLAGAYALSGKTDIAKQLVSNATTAVEDYQELSYTFGSGVRDRAMILETLVLLDDKVKAANVVKYLSEELSSSRWHSTQTISFSLLAIGKYVGGADIPKKLDFACKIGNGQMTNTGSKSPLMQVALKVDEGDHSVEVKNPNNTPLFARVILSGQPVAGMETALSNDLKIAVNYKDMDGNVLDPGNIPQGTDFIAEVRVSHPDSRPIHFDELALSQVFPSGWEITNTRMDGVQAFNPGDAADYKDFRDDRVNTFFDMRRGTSKVYRVQLNAAYQGRFYLPAVSCAAMYDNSINANTTGMWVEVGEPKSM